MYACVCVCVVCRALGIPCRIVTNYSSAHDSDGTATVDVHWNNKGQPVEEWNRDATWYVQHATLSTCSIKFNYLILKTNLDTHFKQFD
jgi:hypothetical protein